LAGDLFGLGYLRALFGHGIRAYASNEFATIALVLAMRRTLA